MADENNNQYYYTPPQDNQNYPQQPQENNQNYYNAPGQQDNQSYPQPPQNYQNYSNVPVQEEKASVGLAILSYLIPIVGLILFLTKRDTRPKTAKVCGICALVSVLLNCVGTIFMSMAGASFL